MADTVRRGALMALARADRRAGAAVRRWAARRAAVRRVSLVAARALSPGFRAAVAVMVLRAPSRAAGLRALVAGAGASLLARAARDRLGRRRPGERAEGGFPSRHAAAAVAIALVAGRGRPAAGVLLWACAAAGLAGRVVSADHEPADIASGAAVGALAGAAIARIPPGR